MEAKNKRAENASRKHFGRRHTSSNIGYGRPVANYAALIFEPQLCEINWLMLLLLVLSNREREPTFVNRV